MQPATILTVQQGMLPPYSQNWNLSIQRVIAKDYLLDVRYVGNKGTHLPRFIEANPSIYGPGATQKTPSSGANTPIAMRQAYATMGPSD